MADTYETLPNGRTVRIDAKGRKHLVPVESPILLELKEKEEELRSAAAAVRQEHIDAIEAKLAEMSQGKEVPAEKRSL